MQQAWQPPGRVVIRRALIVLAALWALALLFPPTRYVAGTPVRAAITAICPEERGAIVSSPDGRFSAFVGVWWCFQTTTDVVVGRNRAGPFDPGEAESVLAAKGSHSVILKWLTPTTLEVDYLWSAARSPVQNQTDVYYEQKGPIMGVQVVIYRISSP